MIHVRTPGEIEQIRECGAINARVHSKVREVLQPGITTQEINDLAAECMRLFGARSSIRDQNGFPADICVSVNEEVGHGVPGSYRLRDVDVVKVDISVLFQGYHTDCAVTYILGNGNDTSKRLVNVTSRALESGIESARADRRCSDISYAICDGVERNGYAVMRHAFGHGIGNDLHESPPIANFGPPNRGPMLRPGMVLAIEPVVSAGTRYTIRKEDGWTDVTIDDSLSAHFEHTVLVTEGEPEVLTRMSDFNVSTEGKRIAPCSEFIYRNMTDHDKPAILRLAAHQMDPVLMQAWGRKVQPQEIFDPDATKTVLQTPTGDIAGFYVYTEIEDELHLNVLVIAPLFQGKGIGKQVMERFEGIAHQRQLKSTRLCVQTNNDRAIQFYTKLGYTVCGTPYLNTLLMRKYNLSTRYR